MAYRIDNETKYWRDRNKAQITNVKCRGMKINFIWVKNWFRIWIRHSVVWNVNMDTNKSQIFTVAMFMFIRI